MPQLTHGDLIITPQLLRDQAAILREKAAQMDLDAQYTDSSQARLAIQAGAREQRERAAAKEAEATALEAELAAPPREIRRG